MSAAVFAITRISVSDIGDGGGHFGNHVFLAAVHAGDLRFDDRIDLF